jgi:hypothetical protein
MDAMVKKNKYEPEICEKALPCPFCGAPAQIQYWHGGKPTKRLIGCSGVHDTLMRQSPVTCHVGPSVTGETEAQALKRWNARS